MLKLNKKVEYGLVAISHMLNKPDDQLTSVREICDTYGAPFDPVAHVLRMLNNKGLVKSEQGAHGGYRVVRSAQDVSLADFIEIVDGPFAFADCLREDKRCRCNMTQRCNILHPMFNLHDKVLKFFRSITVGEMLSDDSLHPAALALNDIQTVGSA